MMKKKMAILLSVLIILFSTTSCANQKSFEHVSDNSFELIKQNDFNSLAEITHAQKGISFSPYFQDIEQLSITTFSKIEVALFNSDSKKYQWGTYDGLGNTINLTPMQFYREFIYDIDYEKLATKNIYYSEKYPSELNMVFSTYPTSTVIRYHFSGSADIGFKDTKTLLLIFEEINDKWYLIAIAHSESTV